MIDIKSIINNLISRRIYYKHLQRFITPEKDQIIVDIGCGKNKFHSKAIGIDKYHVAPDIIRYDADDLDIEDRSVDIVFSAHCLEHCANVLKVLIEWRRVLKNGGLLILVLPHRDRTFDNARPLTSLTHLQEDYHAHVAEHDNTHWEEFRDQTILSGHTKIPAEYVVEAKKDNFSYFSENGLIHHHVWTGSTFEEVLKHVGFDTFECLEICPGRDDSFYVAAKKCGV